uniref:Putative structural protein n=1 Tax=viral metagenome TaxID=1070528 RepID=A0A6H1ZV58_9ZZZZ
MAYTGVISGLRASDTVLAANIKPDIDSVLRKLLPYQVPLFKYLFLSGKKSKPVYDKTGKFQWFEDELYPHQTDVILAISLTSGTLVLTNTNVTNAKIFNTDDLVYIEANDELAYVSASTPATPTCTLTHVDGSTTLTAITGTGSYMKIIGSNMGESDGARTARTTKEVNKSNYLTIFSETISNTGRDQAGKAYTDGLSHAEQVKKKMVEMELMYERFFFLSISSGIRTGTANDASYGKGLKGFFTTYISSYTGALTEAAWDAHLSSVLEKGSGEKVHYCGGDQFNELTKIVKDKMGSLGSTGIIPKKYGARLTHYIHAKGDVFIKWNPILDGKFSNWGFTVDPENIKPRHMNNDDKGSRKFRIESNVETPGVDYKSTKLLADIGLEYHNQETGGILKQT